MSELAQATIRAKATLTATKIHGPNSPDVLSGRVPLGYEESIEMDEPEQYVELTYLEAVEMFGQEQADALFRKENAGG